MQRMKYKVYKIQIKVLCNVYGCFKRSETSSSVHKIIGKITLKHRIKRRKAGGGRKKDREA